MSLWTVEAVQKLFRETLLIWERRKTSCEIISSHKYYAKTQKGQSVCADFCSFTKTMCSGWEHDRISSVSFDFVLQSSQPAWPRVWTLYKLEEASYKLLRLPDFCIIISIATLLPTSTFWVGQLTQPAPIIRDLQIFSNAISPDSTNP